MAFSDHSRQSLIPSYLYSSSLSSNKLFDLDSLVNINSIFPSSPSRNGGGSRNFVILAPNEPDKIQMYSPNFYAECTAIRTLACGLTHVTFTPLDLVKCNMQVHLTRSNENHSYLARFPKKLRPFIESVKDVEADGNCGFRAIAALLGFRENEWMRVRKDLLEELLTYPTQYEVVFGAKWKVTKVACSLDYYERFPGPSTSWRTHCSNSAAQWITPYITRIEDFKSLVEDLYEYNGETIDLSND